MTVHNLLCRNLTPLVVACCGLAPAPVTPSKFILNTVSILKVLHFIPCLYFHASKSVPAVSHCQLLQCLIQIYERLSHGFCHRQVNAPHHFKIELNLFLHIFSPDVSSSYSYWTAAFCLGIYCQLPKTFLVTRGVRKWQEYTSNTGMWGEWDVASNLQFHHSLHCLQ